MKDFDKSFAIDRISNTVRLFFFNPRQFNVTYDNITALSVALSIATADAATIYHDQPMFYRGILVVIQNPMMSKYYTDDLVEDIITEFFAKYQTNSEERFDENENSRDDYDEDIDDQ